MSNSIGKLTLNDLAGKIFVIPYYQRGYRWTQNEASKLFDDLLEFKRSGEEEYCLQPIVLQRIEKISPEYTDFSSTEGKECLRVVDGQQRLTTISILMHVLGIEPDWDIYYIAEKRTLSKILSKESSELINDHFRNEVKHAFDERNENDKDEIRTLLKERGKSIVFLRYDVVSEKEDTEGHEAFLRLNDGKTPLTSSELIRAKYMVNTSGLDVQDQMEISKEWELIENTLREEQFWLMFNSEGLSDTATRMDLLFALVMDVSLKEAKANPRVIFEKLDQNPNWDLAKVWHEVLRCFWWMKSCYADVELFNYLCWIKECTDNSAKTIYENWRRYPKTDDFKRSVIGIIREKYRDNNDIRQFTYDSDKRQLRHLFLLLNVLDCNKSKTRFRFDLYKKESWDIEHIDSQTPNNLTDGASKKAWLLSSFNELARADQEKFRAKFNDFDSSGIQLPNSEEFKRMVQTILELWGVESKELGIEDNDKDRIGNLALLNTHINRSYGNAVFPAKRKVIKDFIVNGECYVPPCTAKAFMKFYTESPSKITYWQKRDFEAYGRQMSVYFTEFKRYAVKLPAPRDVTYDFEKTSSVNSQADSHYYVASCIRPVGRFTGKVSFEEFMDQYHVVIPKIQRTYVQGRQDSYGQKCLTSFADTLVKAVVSRRPCHLDFVYGIDCDGGKVFEPFDGQQRLTTLLLLAWLCGKTKTNWIFRYEARRTTECFIQELLKNKPPRLEKGIKSASSEIKESRWFLTAWAEDPGISGMLTMLDSLYSKLIKFDKHEFDFSRVSFQVNYLDASRSRYDHIFLKMNSRGKPLTSWECVKAVLDENMMEDGRGKWQDDLTRWQELLWTKLPDKDIGALDEKMLSIVELALKCVGYEGDVSKTNTNTFQLDLWLKKVENSNRRKEFYATCSIFFSVLDDLEEPKRKAIFEQSLTPSWENAAQWPDFVEIDYYKPLLAYYAARQSRDADWMRVVWNVLENCQLARTNFHSAYNLINELSKKSQCVLHWLAQGSGKIKSKFSAEQIEEECQKARHILSRGTGDAWRESIVGLERHKLLRGKIWPVLYSEKVREEDELHEFMRRSANFDSVAKMLVGDGWAVIGAALLSVNDYTQCTSGDNWRFVTDTDSLDWYIHDAPKNDRTQYFLHAMFVLLDNVSSIGECRQMCDGFVEKEGVGDCWYYFVKYRDIFLNDNGYYAWHSRTGFCCRKIIDGCNLQSLRTHRNPYVEAAGIRLEYPIIYPIPTCHYGDCDETGRIISIGETDGNIKMVVQDGGEARTYEWRQDCDFVQWIKEKLTE